MPKATIRGLLYVSRAEHAVDEREFKQLLHLRTANNIFPDLDQEAFKALARQQYMMLLLDEDRAIRAIPILLDRAQGAEQEALAVIRRVVEASGAASRPKRKSGFNDSAPYLSPPRPALNAEITDKEMAQPDDDLNY